MSKIFHEKGRKKWKFPKFKKGMKVKTPSDVGVVKGIEWIDGLNWYQVDGAWFREDELMKA